MVRGVARSHVYGLVQWELEPNEAEFVPSGQRDLWALAQAHHSRLDYRRTFAEDYVDLIACTPDFSCEASTQGSLQADHEEFAYWPDRLRAVVGHADQYGTTEDLEVAIEDLVWRRLVKPRSQASSTTVWQALRPYLGAEAKQRLALSAIGQTPLRQMGVLLRGALPDPLDIDLSTWGYWTLPLIVQHGPGSVEDLAVRAWTEDVSLSYTGAHRALETETTVPLAWTAALS